MPIVLLDEPGGTYWKEWYRFVIDNLERGLVSDEDLALFKVTDQVDEAVGEIMDFYSVYNSMRHIRDRLVIRLNREPSDRADRKAQQRIFRHSPRGAHRQDGRAPAGV